MIRILYYLYVDRLHLGLQLLKGLFNYQIPQL